MVKLPEAEHARHDHHKLHDPASFARWQILVDSRHALEQAAADQRTVGVAAGRNGKTEWRLRRYEALITDW